MNRIMKNSPQRGFSLLEVLIGISMFAIGMLALAALQGSLTRSASDANLRTTAVNIAERTIEDLKAFGRVDPDPAGVIPAYLDIITDSTGATITDGPLSFTRTIDVTDYYYDQVTDGFTVTAPTGVAVSDFKMVGVTVNWGATADFQVDETTSISGDDLNSGEITLSAIVASSSTASAGRLLKQVDDEDFSPLINYTPGLNPDIVSLSLDDSKFKESLTPQPEVYRDNLETRFDVITYSQTGGDSLFLRREEFIAVSCECTLRASDATKPGRTPAIWAGDEYIEPEEVTKPYGEVISSIQQSPFCDLCCKDHHDGGSSSSDAGSIVFNPFRPSTEYQGDGNHKHYTKSRPVKGVSTLSVAGAGDDYVEACKLIRIDGFFRVGQDFRMEGLNVFQEDFLITAGEVTDYSDYVTGEVGTFAEAAITAGSGYQTSPPTITPPGRTALGTTPIPDTDLTLGYTYLPTPVGATNQQLRSRSIYLDYLSDDLRAVINCINTESTPEAKLACKQGDVKLDRTGSTNILELLPFFEVQTTFLNEWDENPIDTYVTVTNEPVKTDNTHSRGRGTKVSTTGNAMAEATAHRGVLGLTATDPIDNIFETQSAEIQVVIDAGTTPPVAGRVISGVIYSYVPGVQASDIVMTATDASCNFTDPTFTCFIPDGASNPKMKIEGYSKKFTTLVGCSNSSTLPRTTSDTSSTPFAVFDLTLALEAPVPSYVLWLDKDSCTSGGFGG